MHRYALISLSGEAVNMIRPETDRTPGGDHFLNMYATDPGIRLDKRTLDHTNGSR
jgi:hypothetical protein